MLGFLGFWVLVFGCILFLFLVKSVVKKKQSVFCVGFCCGGIFMGIVVEGVPLLEKFEEFFPILLGEGEGRHFLVEQGDLVCIRDGCDGCQYREGCESEVGEVQVSLIPNSRRGIGFEERGFLVLGFRGGLGFGDLPRELWDGEYSDKSFKSESNLHYVCVEPRFAKFHVLKGQMRFYGDRGEFEGSGYAEYLEVVGEYVPSHGIYSMDYSAIEPRVSTVVSREPEWIKVFVGEPKIIYREVSGVSGLDSLQEVGGRLFCCLEGELDKEDFEGQCGGCKQRASCKVISDYYKSVATDWHGINTTALYGDEFTKCADKFVKKGLRGVGKVVGLALCYGGTSYTVKGNMNCTQDEAQEKIDNFFRKLVVLNQYMANLKKTVSKTGKVFTMFGRMRDVGEWAFSTDWKKKGYAQRTALNHPIQGTGGDFLKIGMTRADGLIQKEGWSVLYGMAPPLKLPDGFKPSDEVCSMASTIHDELKYLVRDGMAKEVVPKLYGVMQLNDVMEAFKLGFQLEMDCEFDLTRSWTASEALSTAKVYCLMQQGELGGSANMESKPFAFLGVSLDDLPQDVYPKLAQLLSAGFQCDGGESFSLAIQEGANYHVIAVKLSKTQIESLGVPVRYADVDLRSK